MDFEVCRTIGADHPSLPGHFPDVPIVPGVVVLDEILAALIEWRKDCRLDIVQAVKFLAPLKPGQPFSIRLSVNRNADSEIDFCCRIEEVAVVEGRLHLRCETS
jgi:3-hydroxyacyl-[acyl-carrier-protein] dehydratase